VFKAFEQTGSAYGVVGAFGGRRFPRRAFGGAWAGELRWGRLTHPRVVRILQNPCYAGAYVFGRYRSRRVVSPDGTITTKTVKLPRQEWGVVIRDHHPAFITWEQYLANEQRLAQNSTRKGQRPVREGRALCQGIVRCGGCGHSMGVQYRARGAHYDCSSRANHIQTPACRSVKAAVVDELIARRLLEALEPEQIALALRAADEFQDRRGRSNRALQLRVERARYEAIRAERAFHACEPDNRLVARTLEDRWEEKLRELKDAEAEHAEHVVPDREPSREQLEALACDLPALWAAETTSEKDRKRLLRALIADVTITCEPDGRGISVGIRWRSGAAEQHTVARPPTVNDIRRPPPEALELIRRLAPRTNAEIASDLNTAGLRTGTGLPFTDGTVRYLRRAYKIPTPPPDGDELTVAEAAERLGVSRDAIYYWIRHGQLHARRTDTNRLRIPFGPDVEQECRARIANSSHISQTKIPATGGAV